MVVFEDALPKKSDYRKFKIRTVDGQDDVGAMGEVIERRFASMAGKPAPVDQRGAELNEAGALEKEQSSARSFAYPPGLVVVDGGKGQLNRAVDILSELGVVGVPVIALAKRMEEVYLPGEAEPRVIPRGSDALYLLQRIRDEAHRFAITYQRKRREKTMTESAIDRLPGVGPSRRSALLKQFGSAKGLSIASLDEIARVPGIGAGLAAKIYEHMKKAG